MRTRISVVAAAAALTISGLIPLGANADAATPSADILSPSDAVPVPTDNLDWGRCSDSFIRQAGGKCATIQVPLDHTQPDGQQVKLRISRVQHTSSAADYQGAIVLNPGGPGGEGQWMAAMGQFLPGDTATTYDWIGFDPRGVGESGMRLTCQKNFLGFNRPDYQPTKKTIRAWKKRDREYSKACAKKNSTLLKHDTTIDTAYDVDAIRAALGLDQITWFGYSYGTYIGQVYASLFPERVRRMVLDSTVDPRTVWYRAGFEQAKAMDPNLHRFFAWIAHYHRTYKLGSTAKQVRRRWVAVRNQLAKHPAGKHRKIGGAEWIDAFAYSVYGSSGWPTYAQVFADWVHHRDLKELRNAYIDANGPGDDNSFAAYLAVSCSEGPYPYAWSKWKKHTEKTAKKAPLTAWWVTWFQEPCRSWPVRNKPVATIDGSQVPSTLMIDMVHDAATPYEGSLEVRSLFPTASLIKVAGKGAVTHGASLNGIACVDNALAAYLADGTLPARRSGRRADKTCHGATLPRPYSGAGRTVVAHRPFIATPFGLRPN